MTDNTTDFTITPSDWLGIVSALINVAVGALAYRNTAAASLPGTRTY